MRLGWRIYATKIRVVGVRAHDAALTDRSIVLVISLVTRLRAERCVQCLRVAPDYSSSTSVATLTAYLFEK